MKYCTKAEGLEKLRASDISHTVSDVVLSITLISVMTVSFIHSRILLPVICLICEERYLGVRCICSA